MASLIQAKPTLNGRVFPFRLNLEILDLGLAAPVHYYSMNAAQFRKRGGSVNFRPVLDSWWAAMHEVGGPNEDDQIKRVWAELYLLTNVSRSIQDVYRDAYLSMRVDRSYSLAEEETQRVCAMVKREGVGYVQRELEVLFLGNRPPQAIMPHFNQLAHDLIEEGVTALNKSERWFKKWLLKTAQQMRRDRKRGGADQQRRFLNHVGHQANVSFQLCASNAWVKLRPWLVEHRGLDMVSQRFMHLMHCVTRDGNTLGLGRDKRSSTMSGLSLALHPISRFLISQPHYRKIIGDWVGHPDFDQINKRPALVATCPEYLEMMTAVLCAAQEYKYIQDEYEGRRGTQTVNASGNGERTSLLDENSRQDTTARSEAVFGEYAQYKKLVCPACSKPVFYAAHENDDESTAVSITYRCKKQHEPLTLRWTFPQMQAWVEKGTELPSIDS